ncbi:MAG: hypothetical protein PHT94_03545 [Candidatus Nanoarchaeia archaeon]|nr:hypothetical protein [Candidatus Nanoarchaeia archaeon]
MAKIAEADSRIFGNVYVCKDCKHKMKAQPLKVLAGKVSCRNCSSTALRPKRKK